jgi:hypothetical protein
MKKKYLIIVIVVSLIISILFVSYLSLIRIFDSVVSVSMGKINIDSTNEIEIIYVQGNATSQNFTVVKKTNKETKAEYILDNYERYNYLEKYYLDGENLTLILRDTSVHHVEIIDTFRLNIHNIQYKLQ